MNGYGESDICLFDNQWSISVGICQMDIVAKQISYYVIGGTLPKH